MGRKPTGVKPGRKTDLSAEQEAFLLTYGDRFRDGADNGTLYTEVTNHWIEKFGYSCLNPHNKMGISTTDLCLDTDLSTLPADKIQQIKESRNSAQKLVRTKIANWFRHHYNARRENKDCVNHIISEMLEIAHSRPRRKTELGVYSEMFYRSKLKDAFDALWEGLHKDTADSKQRVNLVKQYTNEAWMKEPDDVKALVRAKCEEDYTQAVLEWKARNEWTGSAGDFDSAFMNLDAVLPPFADALSKYTGMVAIVTLVGPCGRDEGNIIVQSVQSANTNGKVRQPWAQANKRGYVSFQDTLKEYGEAYYSQAERRARILQPETNGEGSGVSKDPSSVSASISDTVLTTTTAEVQAPASSSTLAVMPQTQPALTTSHPSSVNLDNADSVVLVQSQPALTTSHPTTINLDHVDLVFPVQSQAPAPGISLMSELSGSQLVVPDNSIPFTSDLTVRPVRPSDLTMLDPLTASITGPAQTILPTFGADGFGADYNAFWPGDDWQDLMARLPPFNTSLPLDAMTPFTQDLPSDMTFLTGPSSMPFPFVPLADNTPSLAGPFDSPSINAVAHSSEIPISDTLTATHEAGQATSILSPNNAILTTADTLAPPQVSQSIPTNTEPVQTGRKRKRRPSVSDENLAPIGPRVSNLPARLKDNGYIPPKKASKVKAKSKGESVGKSVSKPKTK